MKRKVVALSIAYSWASVLWVGSAVAADLNVAAVQALTGPYAFAGVSLMNGIKLAADELNSQNFFGADKIRLIAEDNGSERAQVVTLVNRFAKRDNALIILGPTSSVEGLAVAPIVNEAKITMLTSATSPDIMKAGPWSFKVSESPETLLVSMSNFAVDRLKVTRCVVVANRENDGYIKQKDAFRDAVKAKGVAIVGEESMVSADSDFTALATRIVAAKPDCIFIAAAAESSANLILQTRQAGLPQTVKILGEVSMGSNNFLKAVGKGGEGVYALSSFAPESDSAAVKNFVNAYKARFSMIPDSWAALGYTSMVVAAHAIKGAGTSPDRESVRKALGDLRNVPVVLGQGKYSFDKDRQPVFGSNVIVVSNGQYVPAK